MTDRMTLLKQTVHSNGQGAVARAIGYSVSAVNQALHGKYAGSMDNLLTRVVEVYGNGEVDCPVMGRVSLRRCAEERRKAFGATSPQRARLFATCPQCTARR